MIVLNNVWGQCCFSSIFPLISIQIQRAEFFFLNTYKKDSFSVCVDILFLCMYVCMYVCIFEGAGAKQGQREKGRESEAGCAMTAESPR